MVFMSRGKTIRIKKAYEFIKKWIITPVGILGSFSGGIFIIDGVVSFVSIRINVSDEISIQSSNFTASAIQSIKQINDCRFDTQQWVSAQGLLTETKKNVFLVASTSVSSLIQYESSIFSDSEIDFIFTPLTEEFINVVLTLHNFYEVVIGDSDLRSITVRDIENKSMVLPKIILGENLSIGKDVRLNIIQKPSPINSQAWEIILTAYYYSEKLKSETSITRKYNIPIPHKFKNTNDPLRVSVGIINTQDIIDTEAQFKCFKVSSVSSGVELTLLK